MDKTRCPSRRRLLVAAGAGVVPNSLGLWLTYPRKGYAQDVATSYPDKPLRYIVPFPPGGLTDQMARMVGQLLSEKWKVPVVVENKSGGNAQIGADFVAKAPADGYTLLAVTLSHAINHSLLPNSPYDFLKDLRPVALLAESSLLVVVPAASPIRTLGDLQAAAKQRALNAGSSGNGTPPHMTLALFNRLTQSNIQHVAYRGGAPSLTDLMGGQLDVIFSNFPESLPHVKSGKLRAIALCSKDHNVLLPEVPTTREAGLADLVIENWTALMVASKTPEAIVQKLGKEAVIALFDQGVEARARAQGFKLNAMGPSKFEPFLKAEVERWGKIIKDAKITA